MKAKLIDWCIWVVAIVLAVPSALGIISLIILIGDYV